MQAVAPETEPDDLGATPFGALEALALLDWKHRIFALYAEVRATAEPETGWRHWCAVREELYRTHPQSPRPAGTRALTRKAGS